LLKGKRRGDQAALIPAQRSWSEAAQAVVAPASSGSGGALCLGPKVGEGFMGLGWVGWARNFASKISENAIGCWALWTEMKEGIGELFFEFFLVAGLNELKRIFEFE
jgi:hypothetical protein